MVFKTDEVNVTPVPPSTPSNGAAATCELRLERVEVAALLVHRQRNDLGSLTGEDLERAIIGGRLDEHAAGLPRELRSGVEDEPLQATRGQEDATGLHAVTRGKNLAERPVAAARSVGEDRPAVPLESGARAVGDKHRIEAFRRRSAAREGDRGHASSLPARPVRPPGSGHAGVTAATLKQRVAPAAP